MGLDAFACLSGAGPRLQAHLSAWKVRADTLVEDFDVVELLYTLTERVVEMSIASEAGILLADEAGHLEFMAASEERTHLLELFQVQNQEGPCQDCFTTGRPVGIPDLQDAQQRWPLFAPKALSLGFRSVQAVPLRLRGDILGALNLFRNESGGIGDDDQLVVQAMADVATIGLLQQRAAQWAATVTDQLQHALHSRISIEQAKGHQRTVRLLDGRLVRTAACARPPPQPQAQRSRPSRGRPRDRCRRTQPLNHPTSVAAYGDAMNDPRRRIAVTRCES